MIHYGVLGYNSQLSKEQTFASFPCASKTVCALSRGLLFLALLYEISPKKRASAHAVILGVEGILHPSSLGACCLWNMFHFQNTRQEKQ